MRLRHAVLGMVVLAALAGCGGYTASGPYGGGGGGGPLGSVTVGDNGNIVFTSTHNGSAHPAVDTVAVGSTVTWTWVTTAGIPHSVQSQGAPAFASSAIKTGDGSSYAVTFTTPGVYQYDCAVHGQQMTGTIVVR